MTSSAPASRKRDALLDVVPLGDARMGAGQLAGGARSRAMSPSGARASRQVDHDQGVLAGQTDGLSASATTVTAWPAPSRAARIRSAVAGVRLEEQDGARTGNAGLTVGAEDGNAGQSSRGAVLYSAPCSFPLCRSGTRRVRPPSGAYPDGRRATAPCAAMSSCWSSGPTSPRTGSRRPRPRDPSIIGSGGQIVKVSPWGRRRLAYAIGPHREGSYHIVVFDAPPEAIVELERSLHITEEVMRHLVTRVERPARLAARRRGQRPRRGRCSPAARRRGRGSTTASVIDESESEAAPAAID